jgi:cobalt-precorrin-5B (C1)-methyltransferase
MNGLRTGYSTGSCAAAAAKAAIMMLLSKKPVNSIIIDLPCGESAEFSIHDQKYDNAFARCAVKKDGGDDPDITSGLFIYADVSLNKRKGVIIEGGDGVGKVTKPGLQIPVGEWAINPVPRKMIQHELESLLDEYECHKGAHVVISVPDGSEIAKKTFNPKLGIIGGISIIGTTGKVKPFSNVAVKKSLILFLEQAKAHNYSLIVMTPGNLGEKAARQRYILGDEQVVQISNYVGYMVRQGVSRFDKILVMGHPGKLLKIILGCFTTHSQKSISPLPWLREQVSRQTWYKNTDDNLKHSPTVEGVITCIPSEYRLPFFSIFASKIEHILRGYAKAPVEIGVVLTDMSGNCIGCGKQALLWEKEKCLQLR